MLDEPHLLTAARYVELNPVRAGLIKTPSRYRWSSAAAHVRGLDDTVVRVGPLLELAPNWRAFLARVLREERLIYPTPRAGVLSSHARRSLVAPNYSHGL